MPLPSETEPGRAGLLLIDRAAARELFRTAQCTGLGKPGTDEIFDQWLDRHCGIAFYRNAGRPLQARPVDVSDEVPRRLNNSRVGRAPLEAVYLHPSRPVPPPDQEPADVDDGRDDGRDDYEETDEHDETDTGTCDGMPGLCWHCEPKPRRYATVGHVRFHEDDEDDEDELREDGGESRTLKLVNAYVGGMAEDPSFDLGDELPPDFRTSSIQDLTRLIEVAQRKLDMEGWDTDGPWRVIWFSCESDVSNPAWEGEDFVASDDDTDLESDGIRCRAEIVNDDGAATLQIIATRWGELHVMHYEPVFRPDEEFPDTGTLDGLRTVLERATEQVREAGYEMNGGWTGDWSRCYVLLAD